MLLRARLRLGLRRLFTNHSGSRSLQLPQLEHVCRLPRLGPGHLSKISRGGAGVQTARVGRARRGCVVGPGLGDRPAKLRGSEAPGVATPATAPDTGSGLGL